MDHERGHLDGPYHDARKLAANRRWEVVEHAYARIQQNAGAAAAVLLKLMADPDTPASSRIRASLGVFGLAREALDLDIETRVVALEAAAASSQQRR